MAINTKTVTNRRAVRYESLDEALADMQQLAALDQHGKLEVLGNWTLGQAIGHVATWAEFAYQDVPLPRPPIFIRLMLPLLKNRFLNKGFPAGVSIPKVEGGTLGTEPMPTSAAIEKFQTIAQRLKREAPTHPSPAFGKLTHEDGIKLQLRHAELHLSFFRPKGV